MAAVSDCATSLTARSEQPGFGLENDERSAAIELGPTDTGVPAVEGPSSWSGRTGDTRTPHQESVLSPGERQSTGRRSTGEPGR